MEIIFGGLAFVGLFLVWVVLPSFIRRRHTSEEKVDISD